MKNEECVESGPLTLDPSQWYLHPSTGVVALTQDALRCIINPEPIENIYVLDPEPIARGQFAVVYQCTERTTGKAFAAKFSSRVRMGVDCTAALEHEVAVCALLSRTPRAVHLVDVFSTEAELVLVMEYARGGDLQTLLDENLVPYERDVLNFLRQLLEGLVFIHDRNIVHLDIKPQNLVMMGDFPDCAVKLCDFEISRMLASGHQVREIIGTTDYVAPEILHYEPITTRTDMWSVGVLTYVLLTGFLPFGGESDHETVIEILTSEVDFPSELFEDITPEAIDFIKKLLIRKPEKRMSARESLNHDWIRVKNERKEFQRPIPPSTLAIPSPLNLQMSRHHGMSPVPTPPVTIVTSEPCPTDTEKESRVLNAHRILVKSPSDSTKLSDMPIPFKDIGRPPLHPASSQRSLLGDAFTTGTAGNTPGTSLASPFLYKADHRYGSRQNLDRLRSLSKSREAISERVQMSNIKKCLSKSRERLCDVKLGISKSRDELLALSQSVEALSAISHLAQQDLYKSCNNIFIPKIKLPQNTSNSQGRMYQSMASIDQIDKINNKKEPHFESTASLNDECNDILTQRNTDMNCFVGNIPIEKSEVKSSSGLRNNTCKGGRGGDTCESRCRRHRQPEPKLIQKSPKINRAEKMKKETQKRRKEKREKEKQERMKKEQEQREKERQKTCQVSELETVRKAGDSPSSPTFRRGSVSHVEQRIQERHERNLERLEKQEKKEKKTRRRISLDHDSSSRDSKSRVNSNLSVSGKQRPRSVTPTRRSKKESFSESDCSQTSSLESVNVPSEKSFVDRDKQFETKITSKNQTSVWENNDNSNSSSSTLKNELENLSADEAYVSLEDANIEIILNKSNSTEGSSSMDSDKILVEQKELKSIEDLKSELLSVSDKISSFEKGVVSRQTKTLIKQRSMPELLEKHVDIKQLPCITEESCSPAISASPPPFHRSISNTSDFSSRVSESSDSSVEKELLSMPSPSSSFCSSPVSTQSIESHADFLSPDWRGRTRSHSVYSSPSPPLSPPLSSPRSRSNSFNFEATMNNGLARPWGSVCSGSVARVFHKFNQKTGTTTSCTILRKSSSPTISPCDEKAASQIR